VHCDSIANERMEKSDTRRRLVILFGTLFVRFIWGMGTRVDEQAGLHWLSLAARIGNWGSQALFCLIEHTAGQKLSLPLPRKLWAAIALMRGQEYAGGYLKAQDPLLHAFILRRVEIGDFNAHGLGSLATVDGEASKLATDPHRLYGADQKSALHVSAFNGDVAAVQRLLDAGAGINATTTRNETLIFQAIWGKKSQIARLLYERGAVPNHLDHKGYSAIHLLCSIDDAEAAELAPLLVKRGARLDSPANEPENPTNFHVRAQGIPLLWAGIKGRPLLFEALVELHCMPAHRLSLGRYFSLLQVLSQFHQHQMLSLTIAKEALLINSDLGFADMTSSDDTEGLLEVASESGLLSMSDASSLGLSSLRPHLYYRALRKALGSNTTFTFHNRMTHGTLFRQAKSSTIKLLLASGADPTLTSNPSMPYEHVLNDAIGAKDTVAFGLFVEHLKANHVDILAVMSDWRRFVGRNALHWAIQRDARGIFILLLELCPSLVHQADSAGFTPLHIAVRISRPEYIHDLLLQGACPYTPASNGLRPLVQALVKHPDTQAATEIADALLRAGERQRILGPDDKRGNTALGDLLESNPLRADRIRHFIDNYGPHDYYTNTAAPETAAQCLLRNGSLPSNIDAYYQKNTALEILLEAFPGKINEVMPPAAGFSGTPLHTAVWFGNVGAVKILLQRGADFDLESDSDDSGGAVIKGHSAIGLAFLRRHWGVPEMVAQAGRQEIQVFWKNWQSIIDFLVQAGSRTAGRGATLAVRMDMEMAINPRLGRIIQGIDYVLGENPPCHTYGMLR
jgi:ankyrin repeat protein